MLNRMLQSLMNSAIKSGERGSVAVMTAMLMPMFIGGLAITIDVAYWRYRVSMLQQASDMTAVSLATDIRNSITNIATLTVNAGNEAKKNGCTSSCSITVIYPYNSDTSAVAVNMTDSNASRFFSGIYNTSQRTLTVHSAAHTSTSGSGATYTGSACILATGLNSPIHNGAIDVEGATTVVEGCEVVSNAGGSSSIYLDASGSINALGTTVGTVKVMPNGNPLPYIASKQENHAALTDPYASLYMTSASTNPMRFGQFDSTFKPGSAVNGKCLEKVNSGNVNAPSWSSDASSGLFNPATYSTSIGSDGRRIHNFTGGGGAFCADESFSNVVLNFGPGVWYFLRNVQFSNHTTVNGTGNSTTVINAVIPSVGAQTTNGTTIIMGNNNFMLGDTSEMHLKSATTGPLSGVVFGGYSDVNAIYAEFANSSIFEFGGLLYMPNFGVRIQNGGRFYSMAGSDGTSATGCSQMIASSFDILNDTTIRNNCAGYGLQPFGTQPTGWYTSGGGGSGTGTRARIIP